MQPIQRHFHADGGAAGLRTDAEESVVFRYEPRTHRAIRVVLTEIDQLGLSQVPLGQQQIVITVQDQRSVLPHPHQDLHFRLQDTLPGTQMLNVHRTDVHDHRHIRLGNGCQVSDLTEMVHAHFQHRHFRILRHCQDRHRHADIVILIHRRLLHTVSAFQHAGDHFLGGALAYGAGHTHHFHSDALALLPGNITQGSAGILYNDSGYIAALALAQHGRRALFHSHGDKVMPIPFGLQRDKQLPRFDLPGIHVGT